MAGNDALATRFFEDGEQITASITVQKSVSEIYGAWSGLSGLPKFVEGLQDVSPEAGGVIGIRFATGADGATTGAFDVEILSDEPGRLVAWRSTGTAVIPNAGSVTLRELPYARGTEVRVIVDYIPPGGALRQKLDKALGRDPEAFLRLSLFRFRQLMETGEVATTRGQPAGRGDGRDREGSNDEATFARAEVQS